MIKPNCEICIAVQDALADRKYLWNKPLYATQKFLVLPTIGPLEEGHCMIVSTDHHVNLFSMNKDCIIEFLNIIDYSIKRAGENVLFAEHGSFNQQSGGSCIEHTHIHVIPKHASSYNILDHVLPVNKKISLLSDLNENIEVDFPYILTFNPGDQLRLYEAYNAHSQMIRKAICSKLGRPDWDWKQNEHMQRIKKTIEIWERT